MQREQRRCSSQLESCQLRCYAHTHTNSRYANTSPSTTCLSQGSDRIIPGKGEWWGGGAVQFAVFWASRPDSVKKQLSLKHRWLGLENSVPTAGSFSWTTGLAYFPPFTYIPFLLRLTSLSLFSLFLFLNLFLPVIHLLYPLSGLFYLYFSPFVLPLIHSTPPLHSVHHPRCPLAVFSFALPLPFATLQIDISSSF